MPRPSAELPTSFWIALLAICVAITLGLGESAAAAAADEKKDVVVAEGDGESGGNSTTKKNYTLTGIPQIDYVHDPNLPRELNGYNLSDYPFLNRVPPKLDFKCDGRKDGFYASVEHKCQLYHHCLFENRHDFLCPNYTAFDQRTFICQFVSEVDCVNSGDFFFRNDALYVTKTTTTVAPVYLGERPRGGSRGRGRRPIATRPTLKPVEVAAAPAAAAPQDARAPPAAAAAAPPAGQPSRLREEDDYYYDDDDYEPAPRPRPAKRYRQRRPKPRRPYRRRRPDFYDDYYDYDEDYEDFDRPRRKQRRKYRPVDDLDEDGPPTKESKLKSKNEPPRTAEGPKGDSGDSEVVLAQANPQKQQEIQPQQSSPRRPYSTTEEPPFDPDALVDKRDQLFTSSRPPPKIKPPVPVNERRKFYVMQGRPINGKPADFMSTSTTQQPPAYKPSASEEDVGYYDDDAAAVAPPPPPPPPKKPRFVSQRKSIPTRPTPSSTTSAPTTTSTTTTTTTQAPYYEYEYEYEEDLSSAVKPQAPSTTTTTTTTPRPRGPKSSRNNRKQQSEDTIQSQSASPEYSSEVYLGNSAAPTPSGGVTKHSQINEALETPSKVPSLRQPYSNRPRPATFSKTQSVGSTVNPVNSGSSATSPNFSTSTEKYYEDYYSDSRASQSSSFSDERTGNNRFASTPTTPKSTSRSRSSRPPATTRSTFTTVALAKTTTTTSTTAPPPLDYMYYEDNLPYTRYGTRSEPSQTAGSYQQESSGSSDDYPNDAAPQRFQPAPPPAPSAASPPAAPIRSTTLRINDRNRYDVAAAPTAPSLRGLSTTRFSSSASSNFGSGGKSLDHHPHQNNNILTSYNPHAPPPAPPKTTPLTYLHFQEPISSSNLDDSSRNSNNDYARSQKQSAAPPPARTPVVQHTAAVAPEYISLLPEDEEAYYASPLGAANSNHNLMPMMFPPPRASEQQINHYNFRPQASAQHLVAAPPQGAAAAAPPPSAPPAASQQAPPESLLYHHVNSNSNSNNINNNNNNNNSGPPSRFRNQVIRMFPASQEYYPTYAPPPPNYVKVIRQRHVFPTMFFPPFINF